MKLRCLCTYEIYVLCFNFIPFSRLGYENGRDILDHPFFQDFNVASVQKGTYESPYVPPQTFLNGISVGGDDGKEMDPSSFFDAMTPKEEKRFQEMFKDRQFTQVYK